jgi:hypothetical protein
MVENRTCRWCFIGPITFPGEYRGSALQPCMASDGQVWGRPVGVAVTKDGSNSTYNPLFIMTLRD